MDKTIGSNGNMTPAKFDSLEKRPKLRKIKKKAKFDLNTSNNNSRIFKTSRMNISISAANSSVVKASLRANNKALAQTLEKVRLDLRVSYEVNNDLKRESQELQLRLNNLERVAGLKDELLEREVQLRMEDKMKHLKQILSLVSVHLLDAGSCLQDALDKCLDPTRLSINSSVGNSSYGLMDDAYSPLSTASSIYYKPKPVSWMSSVDGAGSLPDDSLLTAGLQDAVPATTQEMTMILEQSVLPDTEEVPQPLLHDLPAVSEREDTTYSDSSHSTARQTAQRVERTASIPNKMEDKAVDSTNSSRKFSITDAVKKQNRRETFVVPATESMAVKAIAQVHRRTFVVTEPSEDEQIQVGPKSPVTERSSRRDAFLLKPAPPSDDPVDDVVDATLYLNTDMEMTEMIPTDLLQAAWKDDNVDTELSKKDNSDTKFLSPCKIPAEHKGDEKQNRPKSKIAKSTSLTANTSKTDKDVTLSKSVVDDSSKSAVVLQLRKPGKIVFSASRRGMDGSRKAITSSKPRSKSKKQIRELKESIAADTSVPKTIFDFHDKTPVHLSEKSRIEPSVYDISMDDQPKCDPPRHAAAECTTKSRKAKKCDDETVVYNLPLKGSPDSTVPQRTTRSKSRSRVPDGEGNTDNGEGNTDNCEGNTDNVEVQRRSRSKSRSRSKKREEGETSDSSKDRGRSRSRRTNPEKQEDENSDVCSDPPGGSEDMLITIADELPDSSDSCSRSDPKKRKITFSIVTDGDFKVPQLTAKSRKKNSKHCHELTEENKPKSDDVASSVPHAEKREGRTCKAKSLRKDVCDGSDGDVKVVQADAQRTDDVSAEKTGARSGKVKAVNKNEREAGSDVDAPMTRDPDQQFLVLDDAGDVTEDLTLIASKDFISRLSLLKPKTTEGGTGDSGEVTGSISRSDALMAESGDQKMGSKPADSKTTTNESKVTSAKITKEVLVTDNCLPCKSSDVTQGCGKAAVGGLALKKIERGRSPGKKQGQSNHLTRVGGKRRENVQDILQAFTDFDDPDHSLHLNAVLRNDSIVIAEAIKNTCHVDTDTHTSVSLEALEEAGREIMYSLPLKDSPQNKAKGRPRSRPRSCRVRSKKRPLLDESDGEEESNAVKLKADADPAYCLPLKGSPTEEERKKKKSRSKAGTRSKRRSKKRIVIPDSDDDVQEAEPTTSAKAMDTPKATAEPMATSEPKTEPNETSKENVTKSGKKSVSLEDGCVQSKDDKHIAEDEVYSMPLKECPANSQNVASRSRRKSRSRIGERCRSRSRKEVSEVSPDRDHSEVLKIKDSPDVRRVKKVEKVSDASGTLVHELNVDPVARGSDGSLVANSTKTKEASNTTTKQLHDPESEQDPLTMLKVRIGELKPLSKRSLSADRLSPDVEKRKHSSISQLKQKLNSIDMTNWQSDVFVEKRSRRAAASVSYKEPAMNSKLRRGDPGTSHFFASEPLKIFKSPPKLKKEISSKLKQETEATH